MEDISFGKKLEELHKSSSTADYYLMLTIETLDYVLCCVSFTKLFPLIFATLFGERNYKTVIKKVGFLFSDNIPEKIN